MTVDGRKHQPTEHDLGRTAVEAALAGAGLAGRIALELPGGASTRRFFRVLLPTGESLVAMFVPEPSQEIHKARQAACGAAFVEVRNLLEAHDVRVPKLLSHQPEYRVLLVEDLGDKTLAEHLASSPDSAEELYQLAVANLAAARSALQTLPENSVVRRRSFDPELLRWEVDHFRDWALLARDIRLSTGQQAAFDAAAAFLAETIGSWPRGFVHRDYQSRNLMVRKQGGSLSLTWIDFQDAMLGPRAYDLVALLMDSYQSFDRTFVLDRLREYATATGSTGEMENLEREFELITVQRKLKDAGRFIFISRRNKNDSFLKYVDSTIFRARSALRRVGEASQELRDLDDLLSEVLGPLPAEEPRVGLGA